MDSVVDAAAERRVLSVMNQILDEASLGAERRVGVRTPFFGPVTISLEDAENVRFSAFARDVSSLGIGLVHIMPLDRGEVIVRIPLRAGGTVAFRTQIVWCRNFGDGWYASGGRFLDVVSPPANEPSSN
jgi:hypothetical protein